MFDHVKTIYNVVEFTILTTTTRTTCYTSPNDWTQLHKVHVSNNSASAVTVTIEIYRASDTTYYEWCSGKSIAGNTCEDFVMDFELEDGDRVAVTASVADDIHVSTVVSEGRGRLS